MFEVYYRGPILLDYLIVEADRPKDSTWMITNFKDTYGTCLSHLKDQYYSQVTGCDTNKMMVEKSGVSEEPILVLETLEDIVSTMLVLVAEG